ncbi:MAG: NUDIX hydrolase [Caldisphaera sp.]|uniref:NUDIX hydrolase n=1 Tax=Caldisphaera sp. TaxID=2060322 RepID=UPI0025BA1B19|nr:CoA pyrophosphatase [Caldisphaera sp.]
MDAAVLVLLYGNPPKVLMVRKNCLVSGRFSCDLAFPGGHIKKDETYIDAALREAWEEADVFPRFVDILGVMDVHETSSQPKLRVLPVIGILKGPIDAKPKDSEVDHVIWVSLDSIREPRLVFHPIRGYVNGFMLPGNMVIWGLSYRIIIDLKQKGYTKLTTS